MIVYKATNKITGHFYIGITKYSLTHRISGHLSSAKTLKTNTIFAKALRKYGEEGFLWEVIDTAQTYSELLLREVQYISRLDPYYNITKGGRGAIGYTHTQDSREKMSKSQKGRKHSLETRRKIADANAKRVVTEATKTKMRNKVVSQSTRLKISQSKIGKKGHSVIISEKQKINLSKIQKEKWRNSVYRENQTQKQKKVWENDRYRETRINQMREQRQQAVYRESMSKKHKELWVDPDYRNKMLLTIKNRKKRKYVGIWLLKENEWGLKIDGKYIGKFKTEEAAYNAKLKILQGEFGYIYYHVKYRKWRLEIVTLHTRKFIGHFLTERDAHLAFSE